MLRLILWAYRQKELEVAVGAESEFPIEIKTKKIDTYTVAADEDIEIVVPDKFEVPSDKPPIGEILKIDAEAVGHDVKIITGKAIIKGSIKLSILYQSPESNLMADYMEHEFPFTEILDLPEVTENMDCDIKYKIVSIYYEVDPESSEIGVEVTVGAHVFATLPLTIDCMDDCYSTDYELTPVKKDCVIDRIAQKSTVSTNARGLVTMPDDCPPIMQVYRVYAKPFVEKASVEGNSMIITGTLDTYVLYLTTVSDTPLYSHKGEIEFTASVDVCDFKEGSNIECDAYVESCSFVQSGENAVDIRSNIVVTVKVTDSSRVGVIDQIDVSEAEIAPSKAITIYFVQQGDTMWDVAKRYRMSTDKIYAANKLSPDAELSPGFALLIP